MNHIKSYQIYESELNILNLMEVGDSLLNSLPIWNDSRSNINPNTKIFIDTKKKRLADAHFDILESTKERLVIQMSKLPTTPKEKAELAHELVHGIQWLTDQEGDLMFITDATRDLKDFSTSPTWKRLMYSIYLSCPQETQAWEAGNLYYRERILNDILPWMKSFSPQEAAKELLSITPDENPWEMDSFSELPSSWAEAYEQYDEIKEGSDIPDLGDLSLEQFLEHYDKLFKNCYNILYR